MHQIYVIKYCILLWTSLSEQEWVTRHKYGFWDARFPGLKKVTAYYNFGLGNWAKIERNVQQVVENGWIEI